MINFEEMINSVTENDILKIMKKIGVTNYIDKGSYFIFPTVCHNVDETEASMKLYYYKDNKLFYCYTECDGMNIIGFLIHYYETRGYEYNWYKDIISLIYNGSFSNISNFEEEEIKLYGDKFKTFDKPELPIYNANVLEVFHKNVYPIEWLNDNITLAAMDKFNIRFAINSNKIIIPHYDINNNLVGIRGRALNPEEAEKYKYMPIKIENILYTHPLSLNLYGLNITKDNIKKSGYVFLFEAEKSVLQLEGFNIPNCGAAVCGNKLNRYQLDILIKECHPKEIILCFISFNLFCIYRKNWLNQKDSPTDKGEDIFLKLLNDRSKVL